MYRGSNLILDSLPSCQEFQDFCAQFPDPTNKASTNKLVGSLATLFGISLNKSLSNQILTFVASSPAKAMEIESDLTTLVGPRSFVSYPQRERLPQVSEDPDRQIDGMQIESLEAILTGRTSLLVTTIRAMQERILIPESLENLSVTLKVGSEFGFSRLVQCLGERGFKKSSLVEEIGQYSVRGGVIDVFSFGSREPFRVEFDYERISSIRFFDVLSQRSDEIVPEVHLLPVSFVDRFTAEPSSFSHHSLIEILPGNSILFNLVETPWEKMLRDGWNKTATMKEHLLNENIESLPIEDLVLRPETASEKLENFPRVGFCSTSKLSLDIASEPLPEINRDMKLLISFLEEANKSQHKCLIYCDNINQVERLEEILGGQKKIPDGTLLLVGSLSKGFSLGTSNPPLHVLLTEKFLIDLKTLREQDAFVDRPHCKVYHS